MQMPNQITNLINAGVGLGRIQSFLDADEMNPLPLQPPGAWGETAAEIKHGTFFWESGVLSGHALINTCFGCHRCQLCPRRNGDAFFGNGSATQAQDAPPITTGPPWTQALICGKRAFRVQLSPACLHVAGLRRFIVCAALALCVEHGQ